MPFELDDITLTEFCLRQGIHRLSLFGSASRGEHTRASDIDLLVEFEPGRTPGFLRLAAMELELSRLLGGREVELRTFEDLSRLFRDEVRATAMPVYIAA